MNFLAVLSLLALLASCGNPHLTTAPGLFDSSTSLGSERGVIVTDQDGNPYLSVQTPNPSTNSTLNSTNQNSEEVAVTYRIEKGDHFRFNGGAFPGTNGSCEERLDSKANCNLDIEFFADTPGVYQDNLIVTYYPVSSPDRTTITRIPLTGERLVGNLRPLKLTPVVGGDEMRFETSSGPVSGQLTQSNPNAEEVIVTHRFAHGTNFRFRGGSFPGTSGNCLSTQLPDSNCRMDIEFFANDPGLYTDELIATYALRSNPSVKKEVRMPLRGEKKAPLPSSLSARPVSGGSSIDFGTGTIGEAPRSDRIVVENIGKTDLNIVPDLSSGNPYSLSSDCPKVLAPKEKCFITVTYRSPIAGTHTDSVRVRYSKTGDEVRAILIPLSGKTVTAPMTPGKLVLAGTNNGDIDFGVIDAGTESRKLVEIENIGEAPVVLKTHSIAGDDFGYAGGSFPGTRGSCGLTVPGKQRCSLDVEFSPRRPGSYAGNVILVPESGSVLTILLKGRARNGNGSGCYSVEEVKVAGAGSGDPMGISFPYLTHSKETTATLSYLYGVETNGRIQSLNRKIVKDAQVYVTFNVPVLKGEVVGLEVDVDVTKVILDGYKDTESLCLSAGELRKCSGRKFTLDSWLKLVNPAFWDNYVSPVTTTYEDEFSRGTARCGDYTCYYLEKRLSGVDIFSLSKAELAKLSGASVNLIFSDDTRNRTMPSLILKVRRPISCK